MPTYQSSEIKNYQYALFSSDPGSANIHLYDANGVKFGLVIFKPDGAQLPAANKDAAGLYRLYYHISRMPVLIDMLRNEKPVYFHFWTGVEPNTHITTGKEPVGEGGM